MNKQSVAAVLSSLPNRGIFIDDMSGSTILKLNMTLSDAFHGYLVRHPEIMDGVPRGATLFFVSPKHPKLTKENIERARALKQREKSRKCYAAKQLSRGWKVEKMAL